MEIWSSGWKMEGNFKIRNFSVHDYYKTLKIVAFLNKIKLRFHLIDKIDL
jgi:5-hydroxyisourate hydrolase-like protein (transthyretin family)